jgi:hypothetical protein
MGRDKLDKKILCDCFCFNNKHGYGVMQYNGGAFKKDR